jgi:multiple sugar transport system ATP-binding protein
MPRITARRLAKTYARTPVLTDVDVTFEAGEYVVLVGPSGCGKSTLLRCIAGLESITSGELWFDDRLMNDVAPRDRDVGMVFQSYALYPHMTVRENMAFALSIRKVEPDRIEAAVQSTAALLEIGHLLDRLPAELSGGQRQRVAMGRALVRQPSVFLFDEPLSNLDPALRNHMRVELKRLHRKVGATIVHVTHDQVEALTLADRIVVLHQGVVQQVGTPQQLYEAPANTFVARFIGAPPMNLLPVAPAAGGARLADTDVVLPDALYDAPASVPAAFQLGVRPADLVIGDGPLHGVVDVIESLGHEAIVHVTVGPHDISVLMPEPVSVAPGQRVALRPTRAHAFGADGGRLR